VLSDRDASVLLDGAPTGTIVSNKPRQRDPSRLPAVPLRSCWLGCLRSAFALARVRGPTLTRCSVSSPIRLRPPMRVYPVCYSVLPCAPLRGCRRNADGYCGAGHVPPHWHCSLRLCMLSDRAGHIALALQPEAVHGTVVTTWSDQSSCPPARGARCRPAVSVVRSLEFLVHNTTEHVTGTVHIERQIFLAPARGPQCIRPFRWCDHLNFLYCTLFMNSRTGVQFHHPRWNVHTHASAISAPFTASHKQS
jgi:hypothetical protein